MLEARALEIFALRVQQVSIGSEPLRSDLHEIGMSRGDDRHAGARCVSREAVELAVQRRLLWFGYFWHQPTWFLTDSSRWVIQARRMDKMRWWWSGPKAMTLPGGQG